MTLLVNPREKDALRKGSVIRSSSSDQGKFPGIGSGDRGGYVRVGRTFGPNNNNRLGTGAGRSTEASRLRATRKPVGAAAKSSAIPVGAAAIPVGAAKSASSCSSQARNISASRSSSHAAPSSSAEFPGSGVGAAGAAVGGATGSGSEQRSRFTKTGGRGVEGRSRFTTTGGRGVEGRSRFAASRRGPDKPALEDATCGVAGARGTAQPPARRASTSQQKVKKRTEFVNFKIRSMRLFRFQVC